MAVPTTFTTEKAERWDPSAVKDCLKMIKNRKYLQGIKDCLEQFEYHSYL